MERSDQELEVARHLEFHGVAYVVTVSVAQQQLHVQVEVDDALPPPAAPPSPSPLHSPRTTSSPPAAAVHEWTCWTGSFPSAYIEELTRKTGNFKRFPIFVNMLLSAISHRSDAVFIDLLTTSDLELYRKRKLGKGALSHKHADVLNSSSSGSSGGGPSTAVAAAKRYLILTYAVEFDRVHYPLPLSRAQAPTPEILQRTIRRLRQALSTVKSTGGDAQHLRDELASLREENRCLKSTLTQQLAGDSAAASENVDWSNRSAGAGADCGSESPIDLQRELKATLKENRELVALYEQLRESSAAEIAKLRTEIRQVRTAHSSDNADERSLRRLQQQLEQERSEARRKLHDSGAVVEETLAQLKHMKAQCDELQLKNRELLRQLAITRARANANQPAATSRLLASARTGRTAVNGSAQTAAASSARGAPASRQRSATPASFRQLLHHYSESDDDDDTRLTDRDGALATARRPPFRRFDPTAYQQERQRKLRVARSQSPSQRLNGRAATRSSYNGGYTSDSSAGGYSSATSKGSNGSTRRGRSKTRVSAEHQRAVADRLSSPKRVPEPDAHFGSMPRFRAPPSRATGSRTAETRAWSPSPVTVAQRRSTTQSASVLPPPHPTRLGPRGHLTNSSGARQPPPPPPALPSALGSKRASTGTRKRVPPSRGGATAAKAARSSTALLADTTVDSFSDIDDRLNALQQFLKQAKQGGSPSGVGAGVTIAPPAPVPPPTVKHAPSVIK